MARRDAWWRRLKRKVLGILKVSTVEWEDQETYPLETNQVQRNGLRLQDRNASGLEWFAYLSDVTSSGMAVHDLSGIWHEGQLVESGVAFAPFGGHIHDGIRATQMYHSGLAAIGEDDHHKRYHLLSGVDHTDVSVTNLQHNDVLKYNSATGKWENQSEVFIYILPGADVEDIINNAPQNSHFLFVPDTSTDDYTWEITETIHFKHGQTFEGIAPRRTCKLKWEGAVDEPMFAPDPGEAEWSHCKWKNIYLMGNDYWDPSSDGNYGVYLETCGASRIRGFRFENVEISQFYKGIVATEDGSNHCSCEIIDCYIQYNAHTQVYLEGWYHSIRGLNLSNGTGDYGLYLKNPKDVRVIDLNAKQQATHSLVIHSDEASADDCSDVLVNGAIMNNTGILLKVDSSKAARDWVLSNILLDEVSDRGILIECEGTLSGLKLSGIKIANTKPTYGIEVDATIGTLGIDEISDSELEGSTDSLLLRSAVTIDRLIGNDLTGGVTENSATISKAWGNTGYENKADNDINLNGYLLKNLGGFGGSDGKDVKIASTAAEIVAYAEDSDVYRIYVLPNASAYDFDATIAITSNTEIIGLGGRGAVSFDWSGAAGIEMFGDWSAQYCLFKNITFKRTGNVYEAFNIGSYSVIEECSFESNADYSGLSSVCTVRKCYFDSHYLNISTYCTVEDCYFTGSSTLTVGNARNSRIVNNTFVGASYLRIGAHTLWTDEQDCIIANNRFATTGTTSIYFYAAVGADKIENFIIANNIFSGDAGNAAIYVQDTANLTVNNVIISNNIFRDCASATSIPANPTVSNWWFIGNSYENCTTIYNFTDPGDFVYVMDGGTQPYLSQFKTDILEIDHTDSPYTITDNDPMYIIADTDGGAITINMPTLADNKGKCYSIKNSGTSGNDVTADGEGAETIDGAATQIISDLECMKAIGQTNEWSVV